MPPGEVDLLGVEGQVRELVAEVERAMVHAVLEHLDIDTPQIVNDGVRHRRVGRYEAPYLTAAGEVGCGTLTLYDVDGERLATRRFARMPECGKASLKQSLKGGLQALLGKWPDLSLVKVADGARDKWTFLSGALPDGVEVLDYFHGVEHLSRALAAAYGESFREYQRMHERLRHKLRDNEDGVEQVIRSLRHLAGKPPRSKILRTELAYFRKNRGRMRYAAVAAEGLPIGSGVVEAACKTLASARMKRSGMRWGEDDGQAILTSRSRQQSGEFDMTWNLLHKDRVGCVQMLREAA